MKPLQVSYSLNTSRSSFEFSKWLFVVTLRNRFNFQIGNPNKRQNFRIQMEIKFSMDLKSQATKFSTIDSLEPI